MNRLSSRLRPACTLSLALIGCLMLEACATNPVTGRREFSLLSEGQELQIGAESDQAIVGQYGVYDDPQLAAYVEQIGENMVPVSHLPDLDFHFRLLDDPVVNAFALPGGYVYITRGILAYLQDEGALAGVMGHEIGHVTARHGAQRYTQQALFGLGLGLGSVLSDTFAQYAGVAGGAGQLLLLKYGRDDERQSDQLGVEYATKLGYDTTNMASFFGTLSALSGEGGRLPSWASTHPDPGERYDTVLHLTGLQQQQVGRATYRRNREEFLRKLDGLTFGSNPREGYVADGVFYHPELAFKFPVPANWKLQNGRTQVTVVSPEQDAAVLMQLASQANVGAAADAFAQQEGLTVQSRKNLNINGAPAVRIEASIATEQQTQRVVSTFIERGGRVFIFHGLTTDDSYTQFRNVLIQPADGFAGLSDPSRLNVQPIRLSIVESTVNGPFSEFVSRYPLPAGAEVDEAGLALMNGMSLESIVRPGQIMKVLVRGGGGI